ncbi:MAG: GxGYxYP family putative glycoside hydrolase [Candidatus Sumerlaeota bacterium]|nr:GxGYxYP family putative glycoside hydrolase [Candidatus Sumerlaeota bacterium]
MKNVWFPVIMVIVLLNNCGAAAEDDRWWPLQAVPKAVARSTSYDTFAPVRNPNGKISPPELGATHMMVQSVAGLAAKAVNEGRCDEMVWIGTSNADYEDWFARAKRRLGLEPRGTFQPWALVDRYIKKGIIKGYILYTYDFSKGESNEHRPGMNLSVNVATSMAGLLNGILVEEGLEAQAKERGLKMLLDARGKTQQWCFDNYKDQFNRKMLCTQDPKKPHTRDFAIAQKALTLYGYDDPVTSAMKWLEPLSPILGWNGGDEDKTTSMSTIYGHIQTATDWCLNLPLLMAGSEKADIPKFKNLDARTIDWNDKRSATSFVITDGDNVQWYMGGFFRGQGTSWWSSPDRGRIPFGWSCCFTHLVQVCPYAIDYAKESQLPNDWFIEWGGGYYYPEEFARERPNRYELLARHARRTWELMKKTNTRIIGFNFQDLDSPEAMKAYEIFAREMDGLQAILGFQYYPYEGGAGQIFWVKDKSGNDVPVITARYAIWENSNKRLRCGTPAKIAREIMDTVRNAPGNDRQTLDWVITHCWSYFKKPPGADENAENMPQTGAPRRGGIRGYTPAVWCAERLPDNVKVISPEELVWRIRMKKNPDQTTKLTQMPR